MGFPVVCVGIHLPKTLIHVLTVIGFIRNTLLTLLGLLGLSGFLEPNTDWAGLPNYSPPSYPARPSYVPVSKIREMLPVVKYSEVVAGARSGEETPESCAVCLHDFEAEEEIRRLRNCSHVFHRCCVDRWMDHDQSTCPLCRAPFVSLPEIQDLRGSVERLWVDVHQDYFPFPTFM